MTNTPQLPKQPAPAPRAARPYEAPRILAKREVERVTLSFTEPVGPGGGIGGG